MFQRTVFKTFVYQKFIQCRNYAPSKNPFKRTVEILKYDLNIGNDPGYFVEHSDVVIIGGGIIGAATAYWLKMRCGRGLSVAVIEKDPTYQNAKRNSVSLGEINQHFSYPENILLSLHGAEFLRNIKKNIDPKVDLKFCPRNLLILAGEKYADVLEDNTSIQREYGVNNKLLTPDMINAKYPWINTDDIKLGCIGTEFEGTYNSFELLKALVKKAEDLGVFFIHGTVTAFNLEEQQDVLMEGVEPGTFQRVNRVHYRTPKGDDLHVNFASCVIAAGGDSADIAQSANIGSGSGMLSFALPVRHRNYNIYAVEGDHLKLGLNSPLLQDTSGLWLRKNGMDNIVLCGHLPLSSENEIESDNYFNDIIKPPLLQRTPTLDTTKIKEVLPQSTDYNTYDGSGIVGAHPYHSNMIFATGFGHNSYQHASGIGRAVSELIVDGQFVTIDLTRFGFDRLLTSDAIVEKNIY